MKDSLEPQRRCVGCRKQASRQELIRVVYQDGQIVFDQQKVLPGRGAWIHPIQACVYQACKGQRLTQNLRHRGVDVSQLQEEILLWLNKIEKESGLTPMSNR